MLVQRSGPSTCAGDARNTGAALATGDVLVFIDADVVVHRDAMTRIRAAMAADPGLDAVYGSYDDRPADAGVVSRFRNLLHHEVHQLAAGPSPSFWAGLGAVRTRRSGPQAASSRAVAGSRTSSWAIASSSEAGGSCSTPRCRAPTSRAGACPR